MYKTIIGAAFVILGIAATAASAQEGERWALLPPENARVLEGGVGNPNRITGTWRPSSSDLNNLEASLHKITDLSIEAERTIEEIDHPEQYLRQYVAVIQDGKKRIYIHAYCDTPKEGIPDYWRKSLFFSFDSDRPSWSAYFDSGSGSFLNLLWSGHCPHYFR